MGTTEIDKEVTGLHRINATLTQPPSTHQLRPSYRKLFLLQHRPALDLPTFSTRSRALISHHLVRAAGARQLSPYSAVVSRIGAACCSFSCADPMRGYTKPGTKCRRHQSRRCRRIRLLRQQQQYTARQYSRRVRSRNDANPMIWNRHQIAKSIQVCLAFLIATGVLTRYQVGPHWFFHRHVFLHTPKKTVATTQMRAETRDVPAAVKLGVAGQATTAPTTPPSSFPVEPYRLQSSSPAPTGQGTFIIDPLTPDDSPTSDYLSVPASEYMSAADDLSA